MSERFVSAADTYEADAPFAEGASGLAHRALSARLGRPVFLKQLKLAGTRDWKTVELFEREAKVLAGLDHPAIPRLLDSFRDEQRGCFVLVQELIDAPSLQGLFAEQRPLAPEQLRSILRQGLEVLDYLHTRVPPVLHRDLSPKNLLFTGDRLFLVDFGAVKLSLRDSTVMTSAGTFGYMAPEQILGQALPASDLYGLGMCIVALATQCDPSALPLDGVRGGVDMAQVLPRLPAELRPVVEAMVRPGLSERVASARDALALLRAPAPVVAPAPPAAPRPSRWERVRRRPLLAGLGAALVAYSGYAVLASLAPLAGQTGQLGGWTHGHPRFMAQLGGAFVGDYDLFTTPNRIDAVAIGPDAALFASAARYEVLLWDRASVRLTLAGLPYGSEWLRFGEGGETLWAGAKYSAAWIRWNTRTGAIEQHVDPTLLPGTPSGSETLAVGTRGARSLVALSRASSDSALTIYRSDDDQISQTSLGVSAGIGAISDDGEIVAYEAQTHHTRNDDLGVVAVRRVTTGEELARFSLRYLDGVGLSPDGQIVALFNSSGVALHRLGEAEPTLPILYGVTGYDTHHEFSRDGRRLAVSLGRHVFVVDVARRTIVAHHEYRDTLLDSMSVSAVALASDGGLLATGNRDELVRLWQVD